MRRIVIFLLALLSSELFAIDRAAPASSGSGFFITSDGYFLTNFHVVTGADKIQIAAGGELRDAKLIKADRTNDIAILKVEGQYTALPLGSPSKVAIGDDVFTIGFPDPLVQGVAPKLTKGSITSESGLQDDPRYFQVTIPIQPGNSGGPLIDDGGNVIGIVSATLSAKLALSRGFIPQNVNFAVKSAYAAPLVESIPGIREKLLPAIVETTTVWSQIRDTAEKAVALVLVYNSPQVVAPITKGDSRLGSTERRVTLRNVQTGELCYGRFDLSRMHGWVVLRDGTKLAGPLFGVGASRDASG